MSESARTYLQQARSFMRVGDAARAVDLLERSRALLGGDRDLEREVLEESVRALDAAGRLEEARRFREYLEAEFPAASPSPSLLPSASNARTRRAAVLVLSFAAAVLAVAGTISVTLMVTRHGASRVTAPIAPLSITRQGEHDASVAPPTTQHAPATVSNRERALKDDVGLVIAMLAYEDPSSGSGRRLDLPWGMGTAFAIRGDGMMLTNRHVVESLTDSEIPWELGGDGEPQLTLRERYLMVCFGPDPEDQFRARIIHQSLGYDMAVLCVGRRFSNPLVLSTVPMRQGDTVYAYGYPGVVTESLTASSLTPAKMENIARKWRRTGRARIVDILTPDSFNPTLTKGIIGAPPRNIRGAAYLQTDAMIARGNSGGPALNDRYEVVGIMTLAIGGQEVGTYSFALLIDQLRDELEDALRGWPMAPKPVGP